MKKIFATVVIVAMAALGLVATTGGTASAACPYSACVDTTTTVSAKSPIRVGKHGHIKVNVVAAGNVLPTGTVTIVVTAKKGGFTATKSKNYKGTKIKFKTAMIPKKGWYYVVATFTPLANSVFNGSSAKAKFKATPHHRNH